LNQQIRVANRWDGNVGHSDACITSVSIDECSFHGILWSPTQVFDPRPEAPPHHADDTAGQVLHEIQRRDTPMHKDPHGLEGRALAFQEFVRLRPKADFG